MHKDIKNKIEYYKKKQSNFKPKSKWYEYYDSRINSLGGYIDTYNMSNYQIENEILTRDVWLTHSGRKKNSYTAKLYSEKDLLKSELNYRKSKGLKHAVGLTKQQGDYIISQDWKYKNTRDSLQSQIADYELKKKKSKKNKKTVSKKQLKAIRFNYWKKNNG